MSFIKKIIAKEVFKTKGMIIDPSDDEMDMIYDLTENKNFEFQEAVNAVYSFDSFINKMEYEKKCECGGETCGTTHSDWCPKYNK